MTTREPRKSNPGQRAIVGLLGLALLLTACSSAGPSSSGQQVQRPGTDGPKTLHLTFREDPTAIHGGSSGTPEREVGDLLNAGLTYYEPNGNLAPKLATKIPSVTDGDLTVAADGGMEITWKLKPGLKWHDGTPLSSEDFVLAYKIFKDPGWVAAIPSGVGLVGEATAPDPLTLVLRYPRISNAATIAGTSHFPPVPRHRLEELLVQSGASAVSNSSVWTTEWVGLGPYKMTGRVLGSQIDAVAFDDYVLGKPKIERLIIQATNDANAMVLRILSGHTDMIPNNMEPAQAAVLKQEWEAAGKGTVNPVPSRLRQMQLQYRDPTAPWASDVRVRQGFLHLLDRQALVETILSGMSTVGHTALLPSDPAYAALEQRGLPKFPFDRAQGERLLDAAGWPRGADGIRRNAAGAVLRFNPANVGESDQDETVAMVDSFRSGGITSEPNIIPETATDANEQRARANAVARPAVSDGTYWERFLTAEISGDSNRWRGANTGGYSNPEVDRLVQQWRSTLEAGPLLERTVGLHKLLLDDLVALPLYYQVEIFAWRKGLQGPGLFAGNGRNATADIHTWTID